MAIPLLDLKAQYCEIKDELDAVWFDVMENAAFIGGPRVARFEREMAEYVGTDHAVACGNGTEALFLIMAALGIGKGDEVITTPFTFWATVEAIVHTGATPVFVDIESDTYNMDVSLLETAVTSRTKAIMPVHIFGQCADMDVVNQVARRHELYVVEDACQAIGATYRDKRVGSLSDAAAFSFFPSKNLGCAGDGGCVTTSNTELAAKVRLMANHGTAKKYFHSAFGTNSRLDAIQAAILSVKLPHLDGWNAQRRAAAGRYQELLGGVSGLALPVVRGYGEAVHHLYILKAKDVQTADMVMAALSGGGVGTAKYYPMALHEQEAMSSLSNFVRPNLPIVESCDGRTFALPLFPGITAEQQEHVAAIVRTALEGQGLVSALRIGAIGFGYWGPNLVRNLARMPDVELVGICDASERNRAKAAVAHPGVAVFDALPAMLETSAPDAVVIASSAPSHHALARQALLAGKHVFVEKPLTLTSADAADLVHLADEAGLTLMVGHLMLYHGAIEWIRNYIASGELGEVRYVYAQRLNLGKVRTEENAFWSLAPHDVSMILHLIDEVPVSVSANGAAYLHEDVQDTVFANLRFASGKMANIHVSWLDPHKVRRLTVVGSKKMLVFDDMEATEKVWVYDKGVEPTEALSYGEDLTLRFGDITVPFIKMSEPLNAELTHFADCCRTGAVPRSSGLDGLRVVQVLEAVDRSIADGGAPAPIDARP